jgi:hypothetical protein
VQGPKFKPSKIVRKLKVGAGFGEGKSEGEIKGVNMIKVMYELLCKFHNELFTLYN